MEIEKNLERLANIGWYCCLSGVILMRGSEIYSQTDFSTDFSNLLDVSGKGLAVLAGLSSLVSIVGGIYHNNRESN